MRRWIGIASILVLVSGGGLWLTAPRSLPPDALAGLIPDAANGAAVFTAAGCASCHTAPDVPPSDTPVLAGGRRFASPFGTFLAPNISPDPVAGIGAWTDLQIATALQRGTGAKGEHLYPAFPYTSYARATAQDIVDLIAHLRSLPADPTPSLPHEVGFPFNIRLALGGWKLLFANSDWVLEHPTSPTIDRGRYLAEALGHCGECHTPRNLLGGLDRSRWLGGAAHPSGKGRIPNITSGALTWSEPEIVEYLTSGFTPDFDTAGGEMTEVIANTSRLPQSDREALAAYLKAVPAVTD